MIKLILLTLFVTVSLSQTLHAKIYKWTDSEGKVHYSATPPKDTKEKAENIEDKIKFNIGKTQPTKSPQTSESNTEKSGDEKNNKKSANKKYSEDTSNARVAYCNGLKRNIHTLETSKNVNLAEEGNIKPLNTKQIGERLAKEKSNLEKNCAGI